MRFDVNANPDDIPKFLRTCREIPGASAWIQREKDFDAQIRSNPLIERYLDIHFPIERAMGHVRRYRAMTDRLPSPLSPKRGGIGLLYAFAGILARVYPLLPPSAQNALKGKISGALKDNVGLSPLAFEMRTVAHFLATGFDVEFHDLCEGGGYDFLVRKAGIEIEVECKSVSGDLGRKVHLFRQYQLGKYLVQPMSKGAKPGIGRLVVATLPDRLVGRREILEGIAARITLALTDSRDISETDSCSVNYREFPISGSPFDCPSPPIIGEDDLADFCSRLLGYEIGQAMTIFTPRKSATVVAIRSLKKDEFLKGIYRELKDAAAYQLSGQRPGIICVQFRNLTSNQLRDVAEEPKRTNEPTGLQIMTAKFFDNEARAHVHTVAYVAPGQFVTKDFRAGDWRTQVTSEDAYSYFFTNKRHPKASDPQYLAFR